MRAQPGRRMLLCLAAATMIATPLAQPRSDRAAAAAAILEQWLGPRPSTSLPVVNVVDQGLAPELMQVERDTATQLARQWWPQPPSVVTEGASRFVANHVVAAMFDTSFSRAGAGITSLALFGGARITPFPQLRHDGPAAGFDRSRLHDPAVRAALAFASLERMTGRPRVIAALRAAVESRPSSDAGVIRALSGALGQDVAWLFDAALDPAKTMNYAIGAVAAETCGAQCERTSVEIVREGTVAFTPVEIRALFADGQSASMMWDGQGTSKTVVFEAPARAVRIDVDPDYLNLLDDNLIDQQRAIGGATNVSIAKWAMRWFVWLQDAMLSYTAIV